MLSFIVPAHDEETLIGAILRAITQAGDAAGHPYEVIVVDDASTDGTATVAAAEGIRVVPIAARQIAKARNAGAAAAAGEILIFVDADTVITPAVVQATCRAIERGAIGGGSAARLDEASPWYAKFLMWLLAWAARPVRIANGCYFFCTKPAFEQAGGFDERLFAGEEIALSRTLKRQGQFVLLRETVTTSGRKMRTHSFGELLGTLGRIVIGGPRVLQNRQQLELWYGPRRRDR
ncbi:MAG TPA: glycosyltransferase [Vicinamibacterales bacterium]|nr:glycosyltransferase [Vicinamibacterales bacterium]